MLGTQHIRRRQTKQNKTKKKETKQKTKKTKTKTIPQQTTNTALKRCATRTPQQTRDEPRCSRTFTASYKTPSVLLI